MVKHIYIVILILLSLLFVSCATEASIDDTELKSESPETQNEDTPNLGSIFVSDADFIGDFEATAYGDVVEIRFSLWDDSNEYVTEDGSVMLRIENSNGDVVYKDSIRVLKEDFGYYTFTLTGMQFQAYLWEIPINDIEKTTHSSGTAYLDFNTDSGVEFDTIEAVIWGLPVYSEGELGELNEEEYNLNSINIDKKISQGDFEVTVLKVGFFEPMVTYGEPEEFFRVDFKVKNIGDNKEYFNPSGLAILDNQGNQYEMEYGGSLDTFGEIYPSITKEGYVLFEKIPTSTKNIKLVFDLGYDENYDRYEYMYNVGLTN